LLRAAAWVVCAAVLRVSARFGWCVFFFSSRRRHTRSKRDWSSDVCSSDLEVAPEHRRVDLLVPVGGVGGGVAGPLAGAVAVPAQIGRASCRERGVGREGRRTVQKSNATTGEEV